MIDRLGSITIDMPWSIAEDEPAVEALYRVHPEERRIVNADPDDCQEGCDPWVEVYGAVGVSRPLTDGERDAFLEDGEAVGFVENLAFERECERIFA